MSEKIQIVCSECEKNFPARLQPPAGKCVVHRVGLRFVCRALTERTRFLAPPRRRNVDPHRQQANPRNAENRLNPTSTTTPIKTQCPIRRQVCHHGPENEKVPAAGSPTSRLMAIHIGQRGCRSALASWVLHLSPMLFKRRSWDGRT